MMKWIFSWKGAIKLPCSYLMMVCVREFYDAAVSGADPIDAREGFSDLLAYMSGNGARTILCESASRFARDLTVQLIGH